MSLFRPDFTSEGPGIPKDAPPKTGLRLFAEIWCREFWQLLWLGLLFSVSCVPVVTIGPALCAMTDCTMRMVRDKPNDVKRDFRDAFKRYWKQGIGLSAGFLAFVALLVLTGVFYWRMRVRSSLFLLLVAAVCVLALLGVIAWSFLLPLLVTVELPLRAVCKNAVLLAGVGFLPAVLALTVSGLLWLVLLIFLPMTTPFVLLLGGSMPSFCMSFAAWSVIKRYVIRRETAA